MLLLKKDVPEKCPGVLQEKKNSFLTLVFFPIVRGQPKKNKIAWEREGKHTRFYFSHAYYSTIF